ncbi:MAG: cupin domain-containing protein [bacterium]
MPTPPPVVTDPVTLQWKSLGPGTRLAVMHRLANGAVVQRVQADSGAVFPPHVHRGGEEVYVISGDYSDDTGRYTAGMYLSYVDGSIHQPWSESGCDLLVIDWRGHPPIANPAV